MSAPKVGMCESCKHAIHTEPVTDFFICKLQESYRSRWKCDINRWGAK